jgi:hypothetical protein
MKHTHPRTHGVVEKWVAVTVAVTVVATLLWSGAASLEARRAAGSTHTSDADGASPVEATPMRIEPSVPRGGRLYESILSATDADTFEDSWYVLDARAHEVHIINAAGELLTSFAREGTGPGELSRPEALVVHHDTVVVAEQLGGVVHLYALDGSFIEDRRIVAAGCGVTITAGIASTPAGLAKLAICFDRSPSSTASVRLESSATAHPVVASFESQTEERKIDPFFIPVLSSHPDGLVTGLAGGDCLTVYSLDGGVTREVCHEWISRVAPSADELESLRELGERARSMGLEVLQPDVMPGFDRIFVDADGRVVYRAIVGSSPELYRLVTATAEGEEEVLDAPVADYLFVSDHGILVGWEELEGTRVMLVAREPR